MRTRNVILSALILLCSASAFAAKKQPVITRTEDLGAELKEWTATVADGQTFELKWVNGTLSVSDSTDGKVHVTMEPVAGDPSATFQLIEHDGGITICALFVAPGKKPNPCLPGDRGSLFRGVGRKAAKTNFTVAVPPAVKFAARAANGDATSTFSGDAVLDFIMSNITITAGQNVEAENVGGRISVTLEPSETRRKFLIYPMNDLAEVTLLNVPVRVTAKGLPSRIRSDVSLKSETSYGEKVEATGQNLTGKGAVLDLEMNTINGELIIRRR